VQVRTRAFNQAGAEVIIFERTLQVYKQGHGPKPPALSSLQTRPGDGVSVVVHEEE
jgi:itaconyl-CoA hydratase